jgi:hypothetical protein
MLVLFETAAGYGLFKVLKDGKLDKPEVRGAGTARPRMSAAAAGGSRPRAKCAPPLPH